MQRFSVKQLAKLANVSVRTLHHYDKISLLKPSLRSETGYRYYGNEELFRLQQILLYKELDLPLVKIAEVLDDPGFDLLSALKGHQKELKKRQERLSELLSTVNKTIKQLKTGGTGSPLNRQQKINNMKYKDLYKGFSKEQAEAYRKEASDRWGADVIANSHGKLLAMDKPDWEKLQQWADEIYRALVKLLNTNPDDKQVQALVKQHFEMTGKHFDVTYEIYRSLGNMYADDERFKKFYDRYDHKLAEFLRDAIAVFCDRADNS